MYLAVNKSTNPYFNLAVEEYLLDHFDGDIILLWRNNNAVIVGRNQNSVEEVNADYVREHNIAVVRRLTGGGAVFHDLGNINFTIIQRNRKDLFSDYAYFTKPVCDFLKSLGVNAALSGRNDLTIDGMKFSGNAQTSRNGKMMHHGTLLFSADVADISGSLNPSKLKIESKSIKSIRSRVTNISSHLKQEMSVNDFFDSLYQYFLKHTEDVTIYEFTEEDIQAIQLLTDEKYNTWEWNYGHSPAYNLSQSAKFDFGIVDIRMDVKNGIINTMKIYGDFFEVQSVEKLSDQFKGLRHEKEAIEELLCKVNVGDYISGMENRDFIGLLI